VRDGDKPASPLWADCPFRPRTAEDGVNPRVNGFREAGARAATLGDGSRIHSLTRTLRGRIPARRSIAAAGASRRPPVRSPTGSGLACISWWKGSRATAR
jgi:hypothetical protein